MMAEASRSQIVIARMALGIGAVLLALALIRFGFSPELRRDFWQDLFERPGGPMSFRFYLQPAMAALAAFHDGYADARHGHPPYMQRLVSRGADHRGLLQEAVLSTGRVLLLGFGMDAVYQTTVLGSFHPGEMLFIALALAFVPYLLLRGPFNRLACWWMRRGSHV
jgi:hypothetical protein